MKTAVCAGFIALLAANGPVWAKNEIPSKTPQRFLEATIGEGTVVAVDEWSYFVLQDRAIFLDENEHRLLLDVAQSPNASFRRPGRDNWIYGVTRLAASLKAKAAAVGIPEPLLVGGQRVSANPALFGGSLGGPLSLGPHLAKHLDFMQKSSVAPDIELDASAKRARWQGTVFDLGPREYSILEAILSRLPAGATREEIIASVWGDSEQAKAGEGQAKGLSSTFLGRLNRKFRSARIAVAPGTADPGLRVVEYESDSGTYYWSQMVASIPRVARFGREIALGSLVLIPDLKIARWEGQEIRLTWGEMQVLRAIVENSSPFRPKTPSESAQISNINRKFRPVLGERNLIARKNGNSCLSEEFARLVHWGSLPAPVANQGDRSLAGAGGDQPAVSDELAWPPIPVGGQASSCAIFFSGD